MNKVLIEICVPATGDHFDIFAPVDVPVNALRDVIASGIVEITNGRYATSGCERLCLKEPSGLLDPSLSLKDYGIKDGMQLLLI